MKREVFSDAQALRTRFYSCPEDVVKRSARSEVDFRHQDDFARTAPKNELMPQKKKKVRLIKKNIRQVGRHLKKTGKTRIERA